MGCLQLPVKYSQLPAFFDWLNWDPHMAYSWNQATPTPLPGLESFRNLGALRGPLPLLLLGPSSCGEPPFQT